MQKRTPFAELLAKSCFSFLEGASHPEEMVRAARELDLDAIALCDRDGLYGSVRAHTEAKKCGARAIVGAEVAIDDVVAARPPRVSLLVEDDVGYANLCRVLTLAHEDHEKGTAGIALERLVAHAAGLFAVVPIDDHVGGELEPIAAALVDAFGDRALVAAHRHLDAIDVRRLAEADRLEARLGVRVVASARPRYHHPARKPIADVVHCIRHKTTLDAAGDALSPNAEARLRSGAHMAARFRDRPAWVARTAEVAARCRFSLDRIHYHFPSESLVRPGESPDDALRRVVEEGVVVRYGSGGAPPAVRRQIEKELALIETLTVAPYFLSVHQIVNLARGRKILCQGRGSAANSAVCYVLGVTAVDPARSNLLFERFLAAERTEPPDIDVDFEHERREEVIQDIYRIYGRDRAAMVSEIIAYRGKSALREVGKVFGLSTDQLDRLSGLVMHMDGGVTAARVAEAGLDPKDARIQQVVRVAGALEGFPRHLSIHVGGFVLSSAPLCHVSPVEPARMENRTVIPWDKDDIEELGFFKVDVLGLGMLTAIRKTLELADADARLLDPARAPFDPIEALAAIPAEDPAVYEAVQRADTIGVFQIESRAQMSMLPRLKPAKFYDLVIEVAIVRPGPIQGGMVHPYLRRRTGEEAAVSPHPCLDGILARTLGVPLFQEQVMQIAMVGADYTAGEADQLRRDMAAWKKHGRLERHKEKLLAGFADKGIPAQFGKQLYQQIQGFGEYGFPESHAASFALLVYASSWLKVHRPAEFVCALLNSQPMGFYSASSLVQDAQRHGVVVRPPSVVVSAWDNTLEREAPGAPAAMRLGLRQIKGFGEAAAKAVVAAREAAPFTDLSDLIRRAAVRKNEIEALAEAGALAPLEPSRRDALFRARAPREAEGLYRDVALEATDLPLGLPALEPTEQLVLDYGRLGLSIDDHPMRHLRPSLARRRVARAIDLATMPDRRSVTVAGLVIGRQRPATASGVTFVTLEDETGMVNLVVRMDVWSANYGVARHAKLLLARGRLEREGDVVHVLVKTLERLEPPKGGAVDAKSRDFH
ncbi:MAG TPA: error-prone DNA polymerase [Byssovorax sp.]|jgi:error-prone DNA polymerase